MKKYLFIIMLGLLTTTLCAQVDHSVWNELLKKYVSAQGNVDYKGFEKEDIRKLNEYLASMQSNLPDSTWSKSHEMAYWINVYNAVTVKLIVDKYPVKSIQDLHPFLKIPGVNTVWHNTYFFQKEEEYSLDEIEHGILRKKFDDPRIHFAINCASKSCPLLRNEAYTAEKLEEQLEEQAVKFINTSFYNKIEKEEVEISKIFSWFKGDFTKKSTLIEYLNQYSKVKISAEAKVNHLDYNWSLNE